MESGDVRAVTFSRVCLRTRSHGEMILERKAPAQDDDWSHRNFAPVVKGQWFSLRFLANGKFPYLDTTSEEQSFRYYGLTEYKQAAATNDRRRTESRDVPCYASP